MNLEFERPVFLGAHPDDNCMGCGGLLSRLREEERNFFCYTFTCLNEKRKAEWHDAMDYLHPTAREIYMMKGDTLPDYRYRIREILEEIKIDVAPDIVFTHSLNNIHQSHIALAEEAERIMRYTTILGHADVKSGTRFIPSLFIELNEKEVEEKIKLVSFFKSEGFKNPTHPDVLRAIARVNGARIGIKYAEAFDIVRLKV